MAPPFQPRSWLLAISVALVFTLPSNAHANGLMPITGLYSGRYLPLTLTAWIVVTLTEAWLIRRWDLVRSHRAGLLVSTIANLASSAVGAGFSIWFADAYFPFATGASLIFLFAVTVGVEVLVLRWLLGEPWWPWEVFKFNGVTYVLLFVVQLLWLAGAFQYGAHWDRRAQAEWRDTGLLGGQDSSIYMLQNHTNVWTLARIQPPDHAVQQLGGPGIYPTAWDVEQNVFVCTYRAGLGHNPYWVVLELPAFRQVHSLTGDFSEVKLSSDATLLCVVDGLEKAVAQRNASSYYDFGRKGTLRVIEAGTGKELAVCPRPALALGLAWSADNSSVCFVSFRDETLFAHDMEKMRGGSSFGRGHATQRKFDRHVYRFELTSGRVTDLMRGESPRTASDSVFAVDGENLMRRTPDGVVAKVATLEANWAGYDVSPSGELLLTTARKRGSLHPDHFLYVTSLREPERRLLLKANQVYDFRWSAGEAK